MNYRLVPAGQGLLLDEHHSLSQKTVIQLLVDEGSWSITQEALLRTVDTPLTTF